MKLQSPAQRNDIKVFIASSVYDFQTQLDRVYAFLDNLGYDVLMSHQGTTFIDSSLSNLDNCLENVKNADVFVGFIRPDYGSGVLNKRMKSITHYEFELAFEREIPRFILGDYRVAFTRDLFKDNAVVIDSQFRRLEFSKISFEKTKVMDTRCIEMYNDAIKDSERPASKRTGNWVQEYISLDQIMLFLDRQFRDVDRIRDLIDKADNRP